MIGRRLSMVLAVVFLSLAGGALAEEEDGERQDWMRDMREQILDDVRGMIEEAGKDEPEIQPLGKTVWLQFALLPAEEGDRPLAVSCATTAYSVRARMQGKGQAFHVAVHGALHPLAGENGQLGLTFEAEVAFEGPEGEGHVAAEGSAVLRLGAATRLAYLGEKALTVTVTEAAAD